MSNYKLKNIDTLRKAHNLTVDDLMQKMGKKSRCVYYGWLKSGQIPVSDIMRLHSIFKVSTDCILDVSPVKVSSGD